MATKSGKDDLYKAQPAFAAWVEENSTTPGDWRNGGAVLMGHLAYDPKGNVTARMAHIKPREFATWITNAFREDKEILHAACKALVEARKGPQPSVKILNLAVNACFGRMYGTHSQARSEAVKKGICENVAEAHSLMEGQRGLDGKAEAPFEQEQLKLHYSALRAAKFAARSLEEVDRFNSLKAAYNATLHAGKEARKRRAAMRG